MDNTKATSILGAVSGLAIALHTYDIKPHYTGTAAAVSIWLMGLLAKGK